MTIALIGGADGILFAAEAPPAGELAARIARVENGLLPPARIAGSKAEPWTVTARMEFYKVPGVSIAVIDQGTIAWARGYGVAHAGDSTAVTPATLFQAASISKPVAAAAALTLVEAGRLALDAGVNEKLKSWKIPSSAAANGQPVTLREILSHTAGLTVHGFAGYAAGAPRPTLLQVLDGTPPANSEPIRVDVKPGTLWRYAGGGYCVLQQLLTDVTGQAFPTLVHDRVLGPLAMTSSTYEQPLPALSPSNGSAAFAAHAAAGHDADGKPIAGDAHVYPEQAAAGLWTTPEDLARFALALQHAIEGRPGFLTDATVGQMITPPLAGSGYGLGLGVNGTGKALQLSHSGANAGFRCSLVSYPRAGSGAIVMTNSDNGGPLITEILRGIAHEYGWPDYQVVEKSAVTLPPSALDPFIGRYEREDVTLVFFRSAGHFYLRATGQPRVEMFAQSDHEFFALNQPDIFAFEKNPSGNVTHVVRRSSPPQIYLRSQ